MKTNRRLYSFITLLVLVLAAVASVHAQNDTDTNPTPIPTTPVPSTTKPTVEPPADGEESASEGSDTEEDDAKTPKPTPAPAANEAANEAPVPTVTSEIDVDRSNKAEYGTKAPIASNETTTETTGTTSATSMGSWLVPAVIGAVIVAAVVFMSLFVRGRQRGDDDDNTARRTDLFFEHPRTNTNHVANVPVLGDPVRPAKEKEQSSMRTVAIGGAPHSPRQNKRLPSPQSDDLNRLTSPGFGTYKQKPAEGSSVVF